MGDTNKAGRIDRRSLLRGMLAGGAAGATMAGGRAAVGETSDLAPRNSAGSFLSAVYSIMKSDHELASQLPGGIWRNFAPRNQVGPFGVYRVTSYSDDGGHSFDVSPLLCGNPIHPNLFRSRTEFVFGSYCDPSLRYPIYRATGSAESLLRGRTIRFPGGSVKFPKEFGSLHYGSHYGYGGKQVSGEFVTWEIEFIA